MQTTSRTIVQCQTCVLSPKSQRRSLLSVSLNIWQTTTYMSKCNSLIVQTTAQRQYIRRTQGCHTSATRSFGSIRYDRSHNHVNLPRRSVCNNCNMFCMIWVVFVEPTSKYSNARQNISGTSSGVRCPARFRSRPSHVYLLHCSIRWINVHLYADDTQLYIAFIPLSEEDTIQAVRWINWNSILQKLKLLWCARTCQEQTSYAAHFVIPLGLLHCC